MQRAALPGGPPRASQHGVGDVPGIAMVKDVKFHSFSFKAHWLELESFEVGL